MIQRRDLLKGVLAAVGATMVPIGVQDVQQDVPVPADGIAEVIDVMQDMTFQQRHWLFDYLYALFAWRVYSDWCEKTKKAKFAPEYDLKDLPEGFDTWVNALELPHMIQLYEAAKSEMQRPVPRAYSYQQR